MSKSEQSENQRPEWVPQDGGAEFASVVMKGVKGGHDGMPGQQAGTVKPKGGIKRRKLETQDYIDGILSGNRTILGRTITLIESNSPAHEKTAQDVIRAILPHAGKSIRIGITGVPGVGKSTFIEAFGSYLCDQGHRVAVLAVDPSSTVSGGSIMGDKTRMEHLSRREKAFIRPSPSGGNLGGVTRKSRETIVLCEAAGFDVILVETVGVGQSETTVRSMVDFFLLLMLPGAGDELQGIKKGVIELADSLVVNKADGDNKTRAELARQEYARALHYLHPATEGWEVRAHTCSAVTRDGISDVWDEIHLFEKSMKKSGQFDGRRQKQKLEWVFAMVEQHLKDQFYHNPTVAKAIPQVSAAVNRKELTASAAARRLLSEYYANFEPDGF